MNDMRWIDGEVQVEDSVRATKPLSGEALGEGFWEVASEPSRGLIRMRGAAVYLGPLELLRFDYPATTTQSVSWPIEGGVLAGEAGGYLEVRSADGHLVAKVEGYRPRLPKAVYMLTQLPVHHALPRLQLLRLPGRRPVPGGPADVSGRLAAGPIHAGTYALSARTGAP